MRSKRKLAASLDELSAGVPIATRHDAIDMPWTTGENSGGNLAPPLEIERGEFERAIEAAWASGDRAEGIAGRWEAEGDVEIVDVVGGGNLEYAVGRFDAGKAVKERVEGQAAAEFAGTVCPLPKYGIQILHECDAWGALLHGFPILLEFSIAEAGQIENIDGKVKILCDGTDQ